MPIFGNSPDRKSSLRMNQSFRKSIPIPAYKAKSKISACKSFTFDVSVEEKKNDEVEEKTRPTVNSYKSIVYLPGTKKSRYCRSFVKPV